MMRAALALSALLATGLLAAPGHAGTVKLESMMISLLQVQDRIAAGDAAALPLQKKLMKLIDAAIAEADGASKSSDEEFRTLVTFGIIGSGSKAVVQALAESTNVPERADVANAVIDYRSRKRNQAAKRFFKLDESKLDARIRPYIAFAKANLLARTAPQMAIRHYDFVRLTAPGTLLEEVSLRRLMALHAARQNGEAFMSAARQYARRFIRSPYRKQYAAMLDRGIVSMRRSIALEEVRQLGSLMPPAFAASFFMRTTRRSLLSGYFKLAEMSVDEILGLAERADDVFVNRTQLALLKMLSQMSSEPPEETSGKLASIDRTKLAPSDLELLDAAEGVISSVLSPIDKSTTNAIVEKPLPAKTTDDDVSPAPSPDATMAAEGDDDGVDDLIMSTRERLKDVDRVLGQ